MRVKTLIVDDDQSCIDILKGCLESFPFVQIVKEVNSASPAFSFLNDHQVDLVFLDIEMDEMDGLEIARQLEDRYPDIMVIFVTGHPNFALQGYEVHPVDFLTKPVNMMRLQKALKKVLETLSDKRSDESQKVGLNVAGGIQMISVSDVLYIEKSGRKISVICKNHDSFISRDSMKNLESIFEPFNFYRSHQSFLVPIKQIKAIHPDTFSRSYSILLNDNVTSIPLSRNNYQELKHLLEREAGGVTIN